MLFMEAESKNLLQYKIFTLNLRSFPCFELRILTAHNLWRH